MRSLRRLAPALAAGVLALLATAPALSVEWSTPVRVGPANGSSLSSLHEVASGGGQVHLVHARIGPAPRDDRVVYQRSATRGATWSAERALFASTRTERVVVPNLAIAATGDTVVVAWRTRGPGGSSLWVRRSTNGGTDWLPSQRIAHVDAQRAIGTPALVVGGPATAVAWTDRTTGRVLLRRSTDAGATFGPDKVMGRTRLSIDCRTRVIDGLVGLAMSGQVLHVAWSDAKPGACLSDRLLVRTSGNAGRSFRPERTASVQRTYGWPELAARRDLLLVSLQKPDGSIVVVRSANGGRTFTERRLRPAGDRALGAADLVLPGGSTAWIVYADVDYRGDDVAASRIRFRSSTDGGATWNKSQNIVGFARKLREATNIVAVAGAPVVAFTNARTDGTAPTILAVQGR